MQIKFLNRILILLTATCLQHLLASDQCIYKCLADSCQSYEDLKDCLKSIQKELNDVKTNCSPKYIENCVYQYCTSDECKDLLDCSSDCDYDFITVLDFKFKLKFAHNSHNNNHHLIKHYEINEIQTNLDDTFIDNNINKLKGHHGHNKRHGLYGYLLSSILPVLLIILCMAIM
ncbi:hypothetical protein ABPG72_008266 [Tetrahymena utriculariae]